MGNVNGGKVNEDLESAIRCGDTPEVKKLLDCFGLNYYKQWLNGYVLLTKALEWEQDEIAQELLLRGCEVKSKAFKKLGAGTPLHVAALKGYFMSAVMLISRGSDVNAVNSGGVSPLHCAVTMDHKINIVNLLLKYDARVNITDNYGVAPLQVAALHESVEITKQLLDYGADVHCKSSELDKNKPLPRGLLTEGHQSFYVEVLRSVNSIIGGYSPLHVAVLFGNVEIATLLLKYGANPNGNTVHGTFLHTLCARNAGCVDLVKLFLDYGADLHARDEQGRTAQLPEMLVKLKPPQNRTERRDSDSSDGSDSPSLARFGTPLSYFLTPNHDQDHHTHHQDDHHHHHDDHHHHHDDSHHDDYSHHDDSHHNDYSHHDDCSHHDDYSYYDVASFDYD